jgi:hypothetical protein
MKRKMMTSTPKPGVLPPATKDQVKACDKAELVMDVQGRTAIVVAIGKDGEVGYIPMDSAGAFIYYMPLARFRTTYQHSQKDPAAPPSLVGTDVAHAARCYVVHMTYAGGSEEALEELGKLTTITSLERETIMKKNEAKKAAQPRVAGAGVVNTAGAAKAKKEPKEPKAKKEPKEPRLTPATTFRELIMKGGLTDDQIFATVQKKHPEVTKEKRTYVSWYRNDLRKRGENPPAPKAEKPSK